MPRIDHSTPVFMLGSCFTDEISGKLIPQLFDVDANPFGPLFNPVSMAQTIDDIIDGRKLTASDFFSRAPGMYCTFARHSHLYGATAEEGARRNNAIIDLLHRRLPQYQIYIFTFGSAIAFRHINDGYIVANCHRQHPSMFERVNLSVSDIVNTWITTVDNLRRINPDAHIIFTVSPVRHTGYGLVDDRRSKSRLIVAIEELCNHYGDAVGYFPAYEILTDDLRDYRFYADDMVHPSTRAVEYIFERFCEATMSPSTIDLGHKIEKINRQLNHRPISPKGCNDNEKTVGERLSQLCAEHNVKDILPTYEKYLDRLKTTNDSSQLYNDD